MAQTLASYYGNRSFAQSQPGVGPGPWAPQYMGGGGFSQPAPANPMSPPSSGGFSAPYSSPWQGNSQSNPMQSWQGYGVQASKQKGQPSLPSNELSQFGNQGNFGGEAFFNARMAGYSPDQIRQLLPGSGLNPGMGVQAALNPGYFDAGWTREGSAENPYGVITQGYYGGGLASQDGKRYMLEPYILPYSHPSGIGPNKNVLFMADPGQRGSNYAENLDWLSNYMKQDGRTWQTGVSQGAGQSPMSIANNSSNKGGLTKNNLDNLTLGKALRIAGGGRGNISEPELDKIRGQYKVDNGKIVSRIDQINEARLKKGKPSYGIGSNAFNKMASSLGFQNYGDGYLGQAVRGAQPKMYGNQNDSRGITQPLQVRKGLSVTGLTAKGDIDTREKLLTKGFNKPATTNTRPTVDQSSVGGGGSGYIGGTFGGPTSGGPTQTSSSPGGLLGGGLGGASNPRLRKVKSRQQQLGIRSAGTSISNRTSPFFNALNA